jgi:hypothetical protein
MTRAEEKAIDAWAIYEYREHPKGLYHTCFVDGYKEGYKQAEKDLALTWEDIAKIDHHIINVNNEMAVDSSQEISRQKFYEEVLRRFNEAKQ